MYDASEINKGEGGPTCLTRPIARGLSRVRRGRGNGSTPTTRRRSCDGSSSSSCSTARSASRRRSSSRSCPCSSSWCPWSMGSDGDVSRRADSDRFGLTDAARESVWALFSARRAPRPASPSLAVAMCLLSAFSLSRAGCRGCGRRSSACRRWPLAAVARPGVDRPPDRPADRGLAAAWQCDARAARSLPASRSPSCWRPGSWADAGGLRLLVPTAPRRLLLPSAALSCVGRIGLTAWSAMYMPVTLTRRPSSTVRSGSPSRSSRLILVAVLVLLIAPLMVAVWDARRASA